jgi:hypothetical protein
VADALGEELRGGPHDAGQVSGGIDNRVPVPSLERRKVAVPVAAELLDCGEELRVRLPAIEHRHLVAAGQRLLDDGPSEELRPAENQQPHGRSMEAR